jgi:hypothetical protein
MELNEEIEIDEIKERQIKKIQEILLLDTPDLTDLKLTILEGLWNLCENRLFTEYLCYRSRLIDILIEKVRSSESPEIRYWILGCLWFISRSYHAKTILASAEKALISELMSLTNRPEAIQFDDTIELIDNILANCIIDQRNHPYLFDSELGIVEHFKQRIFNPPVDNPDSPIQSCNFMIYRGSKLSVQHIAGHRIHEIIMHKLFSYTNIVSNWARGDYSIYWCINFFVTFSSIPTGANTLKQYSEIVDFMLPLVTSTSIEGVKFAMILVNTFSEDLYLYPKIIASLLNNQEIFETITRILYFTMNSAEFGENLAFNSLLGIQFFHGIFTLRDLTRFLRNISFHKALHPLLDLNFSLSYTIPELWYQILRQYFEGRGEFFSESSVANSLAGGGKDDELSIINALEYLIQLVDSYSHSEFLFIWEELNSVLPDEDSGIKSERVRLLVTHLKRKLV